MRLLTIAVFSLRRSCRSLRAISAAAVWASPSVAERLAPGP